MERADHVGVKTATRLPRSIKEKHGYDCNQYRKSAQREDQKAANTHSADGFTPCSQDMTICGDCEGNRSKKKCPRLKEWAEKRKQ